MRSHFYCYQDCSGCVHSRPVCSPRESEFGRFSFEMDSQQLLIIECCDGFAARRRFRRFRRFRREQRECVRERVKLSHSRTKNKAPRMLELNFPG